MKSMMIEADVANDGHVRSDVPLGLPPGKVKLWVVVEEPSIAEPLKPFNGKQPTKSQQQIADEIVELLAPLKGVSIQEVKEGRKDCTHRS